MRIVCPSCAAVYEVPERLLSGGPRAVRCARCGTTWTPEQAAAAAPPPPAREPLDAPKPPQPPLVAAAPAPEPAWVPPPESPSLRVEPRLSSYRPRGMAEAEAEPEDETLPPHYPDEPRGRGALIGWVVSFVLLGVIVWAGLAYRDQVMAAWPATTRLYAVIGLH